MENTSLRRVQEVKGEHCHPARFRTLPLVPSYHRPRWKHVSFWESPRSSVPGAVPKLRCFDEFRKPSRYVPR